jgi:hypothetical protein
MGLPPYTAFTAFLSASWKIMSLLSHLTRVEGFSLCTLTVFSTEQAEGGKGVKGGEK